MPSKLKRLEKSKDPKIITGKLHGAIHTGKVKKRANGGKHITVGVHRKDWDDEDYYPAYIEFGHGGPGPAPAHPFVRPAYDTTEDQAYEIYIDRYAPAFTEAETMIDTLNEEIDQDVLQQDAQAKAMRTLASVVVVLILAAGLVAVFIFTMLMLRYILIPTQKLLSASKALGRGDFQNASFEYNSEDEFGTLASEITRVMQSTTSDDFSFYDWRNEQCPLPQLLLPLFPAPSVSRTS